MVPVIRQTVCVLSEKENTNPEIVKWKAEMLQNAYKRFGECLPLCQNWNKNLEGEYLELYLEAFTEELKENELAIPANCLNPVLEHDAVESPVDMLINAEVMMLSVKNDGTSVLFQVKNQSLNEQGESIGEYHDNPLLNTQVYKLEGVSLISAPILFEKCTYLPNKCTFLPYKCTFFNLFQKVSHFVHIQILVKKQKNTNSKKINVIG